MSSQKERVCPISLANRLPQNAVKPPVLPLLLRLSHPVSSRLQRPRKLTRLYIEAIGSRLKKVLQSVGARMLGSLWLNVRRYPARERLLFILF